MTRLSAAIFLMAAAVAALVLFAVKQDVRIMEQRLVALHRNILDHQEALHILNSEWSYLNRPDRIATLAERHLGLAPLTGQKVIRIADLPLRSVAPAPGAEDLPAGPTIEAAAAAPAIPIPVRNPR